MQIIWIIFFIEICRVQSTYFSAGYFSAGCFNGLCRGCVSAVVLIAHFVPTLPKL